MHKCKCKNIYIRGVTVHKIHDSIRHSSVRFRYGGRGNWLYRNVGNISVLNHEGELMDMFAPGFAHVQTKCKIYAGEHLKSQSIHYKQKVKVKMEWSNDRAFRHLMQLILSETMRDESTSTYADNGRLSLFFIYFLYIYIIEETYFVLNIYIYAFSRRFYPKRLTVHSGYTFFPVCVFPGNWTHDPLRC